MSSIGSSREIRTWRGAIRAPAAELQLDATLEIPRDSQCLVIFVHPEFDAAQRASTRRLAEILHGSGFATLDCDLTREADRATEAIERRPPHFEVRVLVSRLRMVTDWAVVRNVDTATLRVGYLGFGPGAAAALIANTEDETDIGAIVSLSGRVDLAIHALSRVSAPTLLVVDIDSANCLEMPLNQEALEKLECVKRLEILPGNRSLETCEGWDAAGRLSARWFSEHLPPP